MYIGAFSLLVGLVTAAVSNKAVESPKVKVWVAKRVMWVKGKTEWLHRQTEAAKAKREAVANFSKEYDARIAKEKEAETNVINLPSNGN